MAKPIYEMSSEEVIDFINDEAKTYDEVINQSEERIDDEYFNEDRYANEDLFNLYFACDVMFSTEVGQTYQEKLHPTALQMFEPLQIEFRKRTGHPNPYGASNVMKM